MTKMQPGKFTAVIALAICSGFQSVGAQQQSGSGNVTAKEPVPAVLATKLDTKKSKTGDLVTAKTARPIMLSNGVSVPAGAKLIGKVQEVQSKSEGNGTASLEIRFDQLQGKKNAAAVPIHGVLVGVAPKPSLSDSGASASDLPLGSTKGQASFSGAVGQNTDNMRGGGSEGAMGSSVKNVNLSSPDSKSNPGELTSAKKDFTLDKGMAIGVQLERD
ncbi:MAG TPA: hypothetical protein VFN53_10560 [Acidobacteriaceae bacterium]|nr:hypothetical protein [Acidobacteriaceae bacterium]